MENYVIKCLTRKHGEEIIQHFKDVGIDTNTYSGSCNEKNRNFCTYYGIIDGKFSNYPLRKVEETNTPIIEIPKKMYSIGEIKTNKIAIEVTCESEADTLKKLNRIWVDDIDFPYFIIPISNGWLYNQKWLEENEYTIITINQIKKMEQKEIIGYKVPFDINDFIKKGDVLVKHILDYCKKENKGKSAMYYLKTSFVETFEPVYKEVLKVGDWVTIIQESILYKGKTFQIEENMLINKPHYHNIEHQTFGAYMFPDQIRLATQEEIENAKETVYTLGTTEKFEIIVKDGKAFYGSKDVTHDVKEIQNITPFNLNCLMFGAYKCNVKDVIFATLSCIKKESLLSQWLKIKL